MPIDLLPPDDETFVKKKQVSEKQKNHLARARQAAIDRIQKKKDEEAQNNLSVKKNSEDEEEENKEEVEEEQPVKKVEKKTNKKLPVKPAKKKDAYYDKFKIRTEEEIEEKIQLEKFSKFMKMQKKYEEIKAKMKEEEEDKLKIHVKYTEDEYNELMSLLEDKKKTNPEVEKHNPVQPKQVEKNVIPQIDHNSQLARFTQGRNHRTRFGR